ncbi:DUF6894 family protein [Microvirga sp. 2TAF3]|uniref:DUF6894 family protein n=1 Tax=Microvirga sp. 2TAF3 TaxID=3233014 RepID=UPI003F960CCB
MRCYFNLSNGDRFFQDEHGIEISNLDDAHGEALQAIREVSQQRDAEKLDWNGWDLSVVDAQGNLLLSVSLEDVIAEDLAANMLLPNGFSALQ